MPVMIGVDPHKASHTAAVLDEHGQLLDQLRIPAALAGYRQLRQWAGRWPQRCWAVEGAHGIGRALAHHLFTKRRQDLVAARTQTINRLHRLLMDLVPGGARCNLTAKRAAALLAAVTPAGAPAVTRWQLAIELVTDIRQLKLRIAMVEARIKAAVAESKTTLVELFGVGPVLAATFLGEVGDFAGFPASTTSPPTPAPPPWRPLAAWSSATGCHEPGTAS
jgi:hypothetical protein